MITKVLSKDSDINAHIIKWAIYWLVAMGIYVLILKQLGFTYKSSPVIVSIHFYLVGFLGAFLFAPKKMTKILSQDKLQLLLIIISSIAFSLLPRSINNILPISNEMTLFLEKWKFYFPLFKVSTSVTKLADIFFQQSLIISLVLYLQDKVSSDKEAMKIFTVIFFAIHIPLFFIFKHVALIFIIPSLLAGVLFSFSILKFKKGILYSVLIHKSFYILVGLIFRFI